MEVNEISHKYWVETSNVIDSDSITYTYVDAIYDKPKIRQVFWSFIENSINNDPYYTVDYTKICDFFEKLLEDFNLDEERTEFIDSFYLSFFGENKTLDEFHINIDCDCNYNVFREGEIIPPQMNKRGDEIETLKKEKDIQYLFSLFQMCIVSYELHGNIKFEHIKFFENVTDIEKKLFELLYVKFPRTMEDARGKFYGNFDVLKAMQNNEWEKFDINIRKEIIECLEKICQDEKTTYKYLAPIGYYDVCDHLNVTPHDVLVNKVKNIKFKLMWPVYYRLQKDLNDLSNFLLTDYEFADKKFGANAVENFQKELNRLIKKEFGNFTQLK